MTKNDHDSLIQRQFGASAENYRTSPTHARGESLTRLLDLLHPKSHWLALDVATGAGHTAAMLAPRVETVIAGDMTPEMLMQAGVVCRERKLSNVFLVQETADALSYGTGTFDLVTCRVAAHHFPEPETFVDECARVLKSDGLLAVIDNLVPDDKTSARWINEFERKRDPSHARCLSLTQWRELFARNGFELLHSEVNPKRFDFQDWMRRMNVDTSAIGILERGLLDAPELVQSFWQPARGDGGTKLTLQEAILIGRASH